MQLRRVVFENYRGLSHVDLHLENTTVFIGSAGSGKTSIVDILAAAAGFDAEATGFSFRPEDFGDPDGDAVPPIRVRLEFRGDQPLEERSRTASWKELEAALFRDEEGRVALHLLIVAHPGQETGEVEVEWRFVDAEGKTLADDTRPDVLRAQREAFPILIIRGGLAYGNESLRSEPRVETQIDRSRLDAETRERVRELYHRLLESRGAGQFAEASELYERVCGSALGHLEKEAPEWIKESLRTPWREATHGSEARLGLLLLAGALIEARARSHAGASGHPILVVEDPEAHLHPNLLASVWQLMELLDVQKLVTTNSEAFLGEVPLRAVRRIERTGNQVFVRGLRPETLRPEELRKVSYHVRLRRGDALFARCWLLVEGETEFWLLPGLARECGYELAIEGVCCVEFAQCGVVALAKLANDLGIEWHLLADGDSAGMAYFDQARSQLAGVPEGDRITALPALDVEHYLWDTGFAQVFRRAAWGDSKSAKNLRRTQPKPTIQRAIQKTSKPHMAIEVLEELEREGAPSPPELLRHAIESAVRLARREAGWAGNPRLDHRHRDARRDSRRRKGETRA